MSMFSDVFRLFKAMVGDLGNLLSPYPKKRRPSLWHDDKQIQRDSSSYEPYDFLTKEQWQEVYDGKKSLEDYRTIHSWPPQLESELTNKEEGTAKEVNEESEEGQAEESNERGGERTANSENAESVEVSNDSIDSYENSVSEPDFGGGFDAPEGNATGDFGSADSESEA